MPLGGTNCNLHNCMFKTNEKNPSIWDLLLIYIYIYQLRQVERFACNLPCPPRRQMEVDKARLPTTRSALVANILCESNDTKC